MIEKRKEGSHMEKKVDAQKQVFSVAAMTLQPACPSGGSQEEVSKQSGPINLYFEKQK